jgi:hypothetical protein
MLRRTLPGSCLSRGVQAGRRGLRGFLSSRRQVGAASVVIWETIIARKLWLWFLTIRFRSSVYVSVLEWYARTQMVFTMDLAGERRFLPLSNGSPNR